MLATASWRSRQVSPEPPNEQPLKLELCREWTVEDRHLYNPAGPDGDPKYAVLSSPSMIMEMETTCAALAKKAIRDESKTTVGFHVDVKHVSPARPGDNMVTVVRLMAKDGVKLTFEVETHEGDRLVGVGRHRRAIVDLSDLA